MITYGYFLHKIRQNIESKRFELGFMGFGGDKIILSNNQIKFMPKTIAKIYNDYLKNLNNDEDLNKSKIIKIHSLISDTIHKNFSFTRHESTTEYYRYLLYVIVFFLKTGVKNLNKDRSSTNFYSNSDYSTLLKLAEYELKKTNKLTNYLLLAILKSSKKYDSIYTPLEDSKNPLINFAIPQRLTIDNLIKFKRSLRYRYVIDESGAIILGHDNNIESRNNIAINGIKASSHSALNNYLPVIAAGEVFFNTKTNKITEINNFSGHYRPDKETSLLAKILFLHYFPEYCSKNMNVY
ncbi:hypothetical protein GCL60_07365 [Silvanigrella paludirubra]|uniref:Uncharacterized protein n=1 Tax=Silvanigrella paludirubra TaxID=2499159 RepID=A0A6N6VW50_9BACT|nr:hypothetical protein [Silvanigrella paludirubra]KAB8038673.1 hypothetical protein GCL60_07365 [Silvanigrella paludirubra]